MILIDADGCPVVNITVNLAQKHKVPCTIVHDTSHQFKSDYATVVCVDKDADSADYKIVALVKKGDIVITQDYGLAAMCLSKRAIPISQNGLVYDDDNILPLLNARHDSAKFRRGGGRMKGTKKRTVQDNEIFENALETLLSKVFPQ